MGDTVCEGGGGEQGGEGVKQGVQKGGEAPRKMLYYQTEDAGVREGGGGVKDGGGGAHGQRDGLHPIRVVDEVLPCCVLPGLRSLSPPSLG